MSEADKLAQAETGPPNGPPPVLEEVAVPSEKERLDVELKRADLAIKSSALLRYAPLAQICVSLATLSVAVVAFEQVQRPGSLLQLETAQREREVNIPRANPKPSFSCYQQSAAKPVDGKIRFLCNGGVTYTNTGAGPFTVRKVTFRLYRGAPCFYVPGMSPDGDAKSGFEHLVEARGGTKPAGDACSKAAARTADGVARIALPSDPPGDMFWELVDTVVAEKQGFNGIGELNRDETGGASAGWAVTIPSWQYGYGTRSGNRLVGGDSRREDPQGQYDRERSARDVAGAHELVFDQRVEAILNRDHARTRGRKIRQGVVR